MLIDASLIPKAEATNISILFSGEGPLRKDIASFIAINPDANIWYLCTSMKPKELPYLYKICDIVLCVYSTNSKVAMLNKVYDYLAAGLLIINSLKGKFTSFLAENEADMPYQAGDPESLVSGLRQLATAPEQRHQMAKNAYVKAVIFDSCILYKEYSVFYREVCSR